MDADHPILGGTRALPLWESITPRDYFMAHAPHPAPDWFHATMEPCPIVPTVRSIDQGPLRDDVARAWDTNCDPETQEGFAWFAHRDAMEHAQTAWQIEFRRQCFIQWPRAWADLMLEQRKC